MVAFAPFLVKTEVENLLVMDFAKKIGGRGISIHMVLLYFAERMLRGR